METNEGFRISPSLLLDAAHGIVLGDLLMRCLYRVRPYELEKGSANALHRKWRDICIDSLTSEHPKYRFGQRQVRHSGTSAHAPPRDRSAEGQQAL